MAQVKPDIETFAKIKVIGVGGGGNHALSRMVASKIQGVEFIAVNADAQDLHHCQAPHKLLIGKNLTKGLGAGMNPDIGRQAAEENRDEIQEIVKGADLVFVTYGLGGGVGTGAGPVVAEAAKDAGALTVAVVTKPFSFEGRQRWRLAEEGLHYLQDKVDALITIPNDKLLHIIDKNTSLLEGFKIVDDVLRQGVQGISDLIVKPGMVNVDFADVKAIMQEAGSALMGIGRAMGEDRAVEAAKMAINSPLLEISIDGAKGVLFNVSGGVDLTMAEINEAAKVITESIDPDAKVIFGAVTDDKIKKGEVKVTVIATGFASEDEDDSPLANLNYGRANYEEDEERSVPTKKDERMERLERMEREEARAEEEKQRKKTVAKVLPKKNFEAKASSLDDKDSEWDIPAFIRKKINR